MWSEKAAIVTAGYQVKKRPNGKKSVPKEFEILTLFEEHPTLERMQKLRQNALRHCFALVQIIFFKDKNPVGFGVAGICC